MSLDDLQLDRLPPPVRRRTRIDPPPLRVALFTGNYNYTRDGATQALHRLVRHVESMPGAAVRIYAPTSAQPAFDADRHVVSVPSVGIPGRSEYRFALGLPRRLREDVRRFSPDIFHLATPDLLNAQALGLARELGAPVVSSLHTRFETYFDYYGLGWLKPLAEQRLRAFYQGCDYVLAPTVEIADRLEADGMVGRTRVWSRGVDRDLFDPARRDMAWRRARGFGDDELVVAFFGRVVLEKGLALFADVIDQASRANPRVRALVIGDGPARPWMAKRLPGAVFTGFLSGPTLARAVASADVLLNPSTTEAFGNVTLEAMAAGLAVVCADAASHRALVRAGLTGLVCPAGDADAYATAILSLAARPERRLTMGWAARDASAAYSWAVALDSVVEVYREALAVAPSLDRAA